jgi:hypothetical protein
MKVQKRKNKSDCEPNEPTLPQTRKSINKSQTANNKPDCVGCYWRKIKSGLYYIFAPFRWLTVVGLFTAVLAVIAGLQLVTMNTTDQTLKTQQRAWLAPRNFDPIPENILKRIANRTEFVFRYDNVGREPATKVNLAIRLDVIPQSDFRNKQILTKIFMTKIGYENCKSIKPDEDGPTVYPGGEPKITMPLSGDKILQITGDAEGKIKKTHYAIIFGCFVYRTIHETHWSSVCKILEPKMADAFTADKWRTTSCPSHNEAD